MATAFLQLAAKQAQAFADRHRYPRGTVLQNAMPRSAAPQAAFLQRDPGRAGVPLEHKEKNDVMRENHDLALLCRVHQLSRNAQAVVVVER
jgi:hypothetical protein